MIALLPTSRSLRRRLSDLAVATAPVGYPNDPAAVDGDLLARLQSIAIASSVTTEARTGRLRRRVAAVIGAVGVFGWAGAAAAGASVGLATTGNLPAPVQEVVADVLEVVNIEVPRPVRTVEIDGSSGTPSSDDLGASDGVDAAASNSTGAEPPDGGTTGAQGVDAESESDEPQGGDSTSTTVPGSTTSTTSTDSDNEATDAPGNSASAGNSSASGRPNPVLPVVTLPISVCSNPVVSNRNPNCATTTTTPDQDGTSTDGQDPSTGDATTESDTESPGNACNTSASSRNPNCTTTNTPNTNTATKTA
ncbi:MAG: hypothetical protein ACO39Q_10190, partial [Ilumatobacteraceae bacterium]